MPQTLEQFAVVNSIVNGVTAADALFSGDEGVNERCNDQRYMDSLADHINAKASQNQLENTVNVLNMVLARRFGRPHI